MIGICSDCCCCPCGAFRRDQGGDVLNDTEGPCFVGVLLPSSLLSSWSSLLLSHHHRHSPLVRCLSTVIQCQTPCCPLAFLPGISHVSPGGEGPIFTSQQVGSSSALACGWTPSVVGTKPFLPEDKTKTGQNQAKPRHYY